MRAFFSVLVIACVMATVGGCGIGASGTSTGQVLPSNTSFIMTGKAQSITSPNPFPFWQGVDGGQSFVLFQSGAISNDDFNTITTPGTVARLQLVVRNDLNGLVNWAAIPVDVQDILEVNGVSRQR